MSLILTKEFIIDFQNRKWNYHTGNGIIQTGNGIVSPTCRPMIEKLLLQDVSPFPKEFKIDIQNRKWIYLNRKWNYFSHFQADDQKTTFTKNFSFPPRSSKLIFKTGNEII